MGRGQGLGYAPRVCVSYRSAKQGRERAPTLARCIRSTGRSVWSVKKLLEAKINLWKKITVRGKQNNLRTIKI